MGYIEAIARTTAQPAIAQWTGFRMLGQESDVQVEIRYAHEDEGHKNRVNTNRNSVSGWLNKMILLDH